MFKNFQEGVAGEIKTLWSDSSHLELLIAETKISKYSNGYTVCILKALRIIQVHRKHSHGAKGVFIVIAKGSADLHGESFV